MSASVVPDQVAEGLQLSGEQRRGVASLWRNFDGRLARILGARRAMHGAITGTMPNGIMGRDFAVNFLKVGGPPPSAPQPHKGGWVSPTCPLASCTWIWLVFGPGHSAAQLAAPHLTMPSRLHGFHVEPCSADNSIQAS